MSNDLTGNPWKVDTASATAIWTGMVWVSKFVWDEPSTVGHELTITDKDSHQIWHENAIAAGDGIHYEREGGVFHGLIVSTIASGTLYIFLDQMPV